MTNEHSNAPALNTLSTNSSWINALAGLGAKLGMALVFGGMVMAVVPVSAYFQTKSIQNPWFFWGFFLSGWTILCGAMHLGNLASHRSTDAVRFLVVAWGGGIGVATTLLGMGLPFLNYAEIFGGGLVEWRKHPKELLLTTTLLLGGIILAFLSLIAAKGTERESVTMRRILYGANTLITTVLLFAILGLINVLSFVNLGRFDFFNSTFDYTESSLYTLSSGTKDLLQSLDQPVLVYMMIPESTLIGGESKTLLDNCKALAPKDAFAWQSVSRDRDQSELSKLEKKFQIPDALGFLVVYGAEGGKQQHDFIPYDKLYSTPQRSMNPADESSSNFSYLGEDVLRKSIITLKEGKTESKLYFTSGNGELTIADTSSPSLEGIGMITEQLAKTNYKTETLVFDSKLTTIPNDAEVVIIARPKTDPAPEAIQALREFLTRSVGGKKGKAVILLDTEKTRLGSKVTWTPLPNLKALLAEFQVQVGDNQLINARLRPSTNLFAKTNESSRNKVAMAFNQSIMTNFMLDSARTVSPFPQNPSAPPRTAFQVEDVLLVPSGQLRVFTESDPSLDPGELVRDLLGRPEELVKRLSQPFYSVGVFVSDPGTGVENVPGHERMATDAKPRLAVFGDASWISNKYFNSQYGENNYNLFYSTLSWLKDRADVGEKPKGSERKTYNLAMTAGSPEFSRLKWMPLWLMLSSVGLLGGAVWVVRRR